MQIGTIKIKRKCKQAILSTSLQIVQSIIGCMYECAVVNSLGTGLATLCQHWDQSSGSREPDNTANANIGLVNTNQVTQITRDNQS